MRAALTLAVALVGAGCASLRPEIVCNPHTGEASVLQSISIVTSKQDIRAEKECAAFRPAPAPAAAPAAAASAAASAPTN